MNATDNHNKFSDKLETWVKHSKPKTIGSMGDTFGQKSPAVIILFLMVIPALPLPTGGVTHVFEIITMLLILELIAGVDKLWVPNRFKHVKILPTDGGKAASIILRKIRWLEQKSSPRWKFVFSSVLIVRIIWIIAFIFTITAFLAPPFSGLDTLPALGVVLICASIILEDSLILLLGLLAGILGTTLVIGLAAATVNLIHKIL